MEINLLQAIHALLVSTGFVTLTIQQGIMLMISFILLYLAIVKGFEPLLLMPIAFGMLLANLPHAGLMAPPTMEIDAIRQEKTVVGGLLWYLYQGVKLGIYPPLIFLGVGAMTDFGPLIANPKSLLLGAAAQLGIFITFIGALCSALTRRRRLNRHHRRGRWPDGDLRDHQAGAPPAGAHRRGSILLHGAGADHPAADHEAADDQEERMVVMEQLRPVSKTERIVFPIVVTVVVSLMLPVRRRWSAC